jgi:hypothetical protein
VQPLPQGFARPFSKSDEKIGSHFESLFDHPLAFAEMDDETGDEQPGSRSLVPLGKKGFL